MKKKILLSMLVVLVIVFSFVGCEQTNNTPSSNVITNNVETSSGENNTVPKRDVNRYANIEKNPEATIEMEDGRIIKMELYPKVAPETVENFIELANSGFYDGLIFHRVKPDFVIQGGDPEGYGYGGPGYTIIGEFSANGYKNNIDHTRGIVSMARSEDYNSAGSQFFIVVDDIYKESLNGGYAAFGKVIEGMDVVDEIVNLEVVRTQVDIKSIETAEDYAEYINQMKEVDRPINPPVISKITVDTFGVQYESPTKLVTE